MIQTDFEDYLSEHERVHGVGSSPLLYVPAPVPKRPRREGQGMVQIDIEEWLAENETAAADPGPKPSIPFSETIAAPTGSEDEAATGQHHEEAHTLESFEEAAHVQDRPSTSAQDYLSLLRPIQRMMDPGTERRPAVCLCGYARGKTVGVHLIERNEKTRATIGGVYRCGNGELCPYCAPRIAALRARRYRRVHEAVMAKDGRLIAVTLTMAHGPDDRLGDLVRAMKTAANGARSGGMWNREIKVMLDVAGVLVDLHVRWSRAGGWHPHLHLTIACGTDDEAVISKAVNMLIRRYAALLAKAGYHADIDHQDVTILRNDETERGYAYPAHHHRPAAVDGDLHANMDDETSLSPFDLARLAADGDKDAEALFKDFAGAVRGMKCAVVTASMASALGIEPDNDDAPVLDDSTRVGTLPSPVWSGLLNKHMGGTLLQYVVSFGRQGWRKVWWWAHEQTGFAPPIAQREAEEIIDLLIAEQSFEDPSAKTMARDMIRWRLEAVTEAHSSAIAAASLDYAEAHWRYVETGTERIETLMAGIERWSGKRALMQRQSDTDTPQSPPSLFMGLAMADASVPVG